MENKQAWCMTCFDWRQDPQQLIDGDTCSHCGGRGEIFACDIDAPAALREMTRKLCRENEDLRNKLSDARELVDQLESLFRP